MKQIKKLTAVLVAVLLLVSIIPLGTFTASAAQRDVYYDYTIKDGEVTIDYIWLEEDVEVLDIPSSFNGYPVTRIGGNALSGCDVFDSIIVPEGVVSIGEFAFGFSARGIESITLPNSLINIDSYAFDYCDNLKTVYYGGTYEEWNNISMLPYNAPLKNAQFVGNYSDIMPYFTYEIQDEEVIITDCDTSISGNIEIPAIIDGYPVTGIGDNAFADCDKITGILLLNNMVSIGDYAFQNCTALGNIKVADSVTDIGDYAFYNCTSLASAKIGNNLSHIGNYAFSGCQLENIYYTGTADNWNNIPKGSYNDSILNANIIYNYVDIIPHINYQISNETVTITDCDENICGNTVIPDTINGYPVTIIGGSAFGYCSNLTGITIPDSITIIGGGAFNYCTSLTSITIPDSVTTIGDAAFANCQGLKSVAIGSGVTSIGGNAFYGCDYINEVYITDLKAWCEIDFKANDSNPIYPMNGLWPPEKGVDLYYNGSLLVDAIIPDGITKIGDFAFSGCTTLTSITIPESVTSIGSNAFEYCHGLTSVIIGDGVTSIGSRAFWNCENIESVTIPVSVTHIYEEAFYNGLNDVWYTGNENDRANIIIDGYYNDAILGQATWHYNICNANEHEYDSPYDATCNNCEWVRDALPGLAFYSASLTLQNNLAFNYKVDSALFAKGKYENPYVVFNMNGKEIKVDTYTVDGDKYVFTLLGITPDKMNDTITATLNATYEGEAISATKKYSVAEYCYSMLNRYSGNENIRTLVVDLLNYGAAAQLYSGYKADTLVNANLTAEQVAWGTSKNPVYSNVFNTKYEVVNNATVYWKGAGLTLLENVAMRFKFKTDNIDGLTVNISTSTDEWNITSDEFKKDGNYYYVVFDKLGADKMDEVVFLIVYKGGEAVSNTAVYSIESYAYAMQNSSDKNLVNLLRAMIKYGNSAKNYNG